MQSRVVLLALLLPFSLSLPLRASADDSARDRIRIAAEAMGGVDALRELRTLRIEGIGHIHLLEQSERPGGPYLDQFEQFSELRDVAAGRVRREATERGTFNEEWAPQTTIVADGVAAATRGDKLLPASAGEIDDAAVRLALAPERIVTAALDAKDLASEPDADIQGARHHVVVWTWQGSQVRLFLNAGSGLPSAAEVVRPFPRDVYWYGWGDVRVRFVYSNWQLQGKLVYPMQLDEERNGQPYRTFVATKLEANPDASPDAFAIPDDVRALFASKALASYDDAPLGRADRPAVELAPGIVFVPGNWNVTLVRQDDGVVVIEAPISSGYSAKALDEARRRFPDVPVKAVVTTADSWPHIAGLREYAARGVRIYALDLNVALVRRLLDAPHALRPDALAREPRTARIEAVSGKTVVGSGPNALELYPVRGQGGERMLMVYAPGRRLLYGADLVQPLPDGGFFSKQYIAELVAAVRREHLDVETVYAMHAGAIPWDKIVAGAGPSARSRER